MNIFAQIARELREKNEGRIWRASGHWLLTPGETRDKGTYPIPGKENEPLLCDRLALISTDIRGRKMRLIHKSSVSCPNPEYAEQFADIGKKMVKLSVPESFCRKCQWYRSARRSRRRYATCQYVAAKRPGEATAKEFGQLLSKAVGKANELLS